MAYAGACGSTRRTGDKENAEEPIVPELSWRTASGFSSGEQPFPALRNACAHNSLIVNGFSRSSKRTPYDPPKLISDSLNMRGMKNTKARRSKLANLRVAQIAATLCLDSELCTRESTKARHVARLAEARSYAESCGVLRRAHDGIVSYFDFVWKLVDTWLPSRH